MGFCLFTVAGGSPPSGIGGVTTGDCSVVGFVGDCLAVTCVLGIVLITSSFIAT